jgi:pimeloyl-ACP methyl ester carboxylesterase
MQEANKRLTPDQAHHLTIHGIDQNEDGTYSWKFDNYVRVFPPYGLSEKERQSLWARISCPTLLIRGTESWDTNPKEDGRASHFHAAKIIDMSGAGHWVHHDRLQEFVTLVEDFLTC